jgi:AraC family transcriptional regulator of adaptative response/methylated-DNA-[protein]-cysteine methyltransferase
MGLVDDDLWRAAGERDTRYDGFFVFAVRSTGVYCRPSCPARRPKRENAVFFEHPEAAECAGFRPCKRCQPQDPAALNPRVVLAWRACDLIEANIEDPPTLAALCSSLYVSPHHLQCTFKHLVGVTPRQYAEARRIARLKVRLKEGEPVTCAL